MLSKPNVNEITPRVGNRYQSVLAIAKRARDIEAARVAKKAEAKEKNAELKETVVEPVEDAVDIASKEIAEGKVYIKINGKYSITPESEMERELQEIQHEAELAQKENKE